MAAKKQRPAGASLATTIGGVLAGFEQQVMRRLPPADELVHHARPDAPVAAGGEEWRIDLPAAAPAGDPEPDPAR